MALHVQSGSATGKHNIAGKKYDRCVTLESECRVTYLCHRSGPEDTAKDVTRDIHYSIRSHSVRLSNTFQANAPVMALGVCTQHQQDTTPATVIDSVPRDHTVKCTKHQQDMHDPRTGTADGGPACVGHPPTSYSSSSSASRVIADFQGWKQNLGFYTSKGSPVYFGFEIPGRSFFHGHEQVCFLSRMYLNRFVKTFLFTKRCLK